MRKVFFSFHYKEDVWRTSQVRNIGTVEGNRPFSDNDWEQVKRGGDAAIKKWVTEQMEKRSCTIVLVGANTANRQWINYEITESWKRRMGVAGIYIHGLADGYGLISVQGGNPFDYLALGSVKLSSVVQCHTPIGIDSKDKYGWIKNNLSGIVEQAIYIRNSYK